MFRIFIAAVFLVIAGAFSAAAADDGLVKKQSAFSFEETIAKFEAALAERNISVFMKIDHAGGAASDRQLGCRPGA